jgi:hypothetical protein
MREVSAWDGECSTDAIDAHLGRRRPTGGHLRSWRGLIALLVPQRYYIERSCHRQSIEHLIRVRRRRLRVAWLWYKRKGLSLRLGLSPSAAPKKPVQFRRTIKPARRHGFQMSACCRRVTIDHRGLRGGLARSSCEARSICSCKSKDVMSARTLAKFRPRCRPDHVVVSTCTWPRYTAVC